MMKEVYFEMMEILQDMAGLVKVIENNLDMRNTVFEYDKAENRMHTYLKKLDNLYPFGTDTDLDERIINLNRTIALVNLSGGEVLEMDGGEIVCIDAWTEVQYSIRRFYTSLRF